MYRQTSDTEFESEMEEGRTLIRKNQSINQSTSLIGVFVLIVGVLSLVGMIVAINRSINQPVNQSWTEKVSHAFYQSMPESEIDTDQSINQLIDQSINQWVDPLPSCSILNPNITHNIIHHQSMIQHHHVHSDCSAYVLTGQCIYDPSINSSTNPSDQSTDQSINQPINHFSFRPKWMVFHINSGPGKKGTGGLADRLKGLLTVYGLSLLMGRSMALFVEDFVPFTATFQRGVIEWIPYESIDQSIRNGGKVKTINWQGIWDHRPLTDREYHDWLVDWEPYDVIQIEYNMNGFTDLMDHRRFFPAYRAFGFHSATEKGDMDMYWECLMDSLFSYTTPVLQVINPLMDMINRPHLKTWEERALTIPSINHIVKRQAIEQRVLSYSKQAYDRLVDGMYQKSLKAYHAKYSKAENPSMYHSTDQSSLNPFPLYCLQIRMGSNGQQQTNNNTIEFKDFEGFLKVDQLQDVFKVFESKISSHLDNHPQFDRSTATLFITGDSDAYLQFIPESLKGSSMMVVPGRTAHIDMLQALMNDPSIMIEAVIKTLATHYILGECDVAYVTESGFGPTGLWRGRNRLHAEHPFEDQVWEDKFMISKQGTIAPYVHMRGAAGREYSIEHRPIKPETRTIIENEILVNQSIIQAFKPEKHGKFQSSARLDYPVPVDPACVKMKVFKL